MRIIFMGTPDFSVPTLHALHIAGHDIVAVYSQPPRRSGRGKNIHASPVQQAAERLGLPVFHPISFRKAPEEWERFAAFNADIAIVVAYGLLLPEVILNTPRLGCVNIHASLLPRWRGASPIQSAILAGDTQSGITLMRMDAGLDTGPTLLQESVPITPKTTANQLHDRLSTLGAEMMVRLLQNVTHALPPACPQPETGVTYAHRLTREEGCIPWSDDAEAIDRRIRALTPWPGTFTTLTTSTHPPHTLFLKIGEAKPAPLPVNQTNIMPGTIIDNANNVPLVACGHQTALKLLRIQRPGKEMMDAPTFLRGLPLPIGTILGTSLEASPPSP